MKREALLGGATLFLCAVLFYETTLIADYGFAQVSADVWPRMILGAISALSLLQVVTALYRPPSSTHGNPGAPDGGWLFNAFVPITVFVAVVIFALLVGYIGFMLSGLIMVFTLLSVIGPKTPRAVVIHAAIAAVSVIGITVFFSEIMGVLLPGWAL